MNNATAPELKWDAASITQRPTFLVHRINAELARLCNPAFRRLGVDLITSRILVLLLEQDRAYVGDLVDAMALPQSTVSHQVKRLEQARLITRRPDETDNRAYLISLTRKGRTVATKCSKLSDSIYTELFGTTHPAEMQQLVQSLQQMELNLQSIDPAKLNSGL